MFTFGIFTTHIPYIAIVAFYAYFLLFGVNKVSEGNIKVVEKSHPIQFHIDNSVKQAPADTYGFYCTFAESSEIEILEKSVVKQKWKHFGVDKIFSQNCPEYALFGRPPPALA